ncbi:Ribonuclease H2 subunit B [Zostera marina]|uniref:Ribonuclease H2 subunit B n=1 Tax=Zostera marina TaxID=29655 RepID=A0A0K9NMK7_ZOSMR|nr:Ribonuclease H2 subunit B [Zostera marina]
MRFLSSPLPPFPNLLVTPPPMETWSDGINKPRLLIAPHTGEEKEGCRKGCMLSLRHPKSGEATSYLLRNGFMQEQQWFKQSYGSWFLGDYVSEDGGLYISTPVDIVFILLPLFDEARMKKGNDCGMFRELNEICYVDGYPGYQHLVPFAENSMKLLCEMKEVGSSKFFRLDDSKVLAWLCHKIKRLKETFPKLDRNYSTREESDILFDAVSLLGEYLKNDPWLKLICTHLNLDLQSSARGYTNEGPLLSAIKNSQSDPIPQQTRKTNGRNVSTAKKQKTQVESKNIKDMFRRATRDSGGGKT